MVVRVSKCVPECVRSSADSIVRSERREWGQRTTFRARVIDPSTYNMPCEPIRRKTAVKVVITYRNNVFLLRAALSAQASAAVVWAEGRTWLDTKRMMGSEGALYQDSRRTRFLRSTMV